MIKKNYFYIVLAAAGLSLLLIFISLSSGSEESSQATPLSSHPTSPFKSSIFGVGIVESSSRNISLGAPSGRIVKKVEVKVGQEVKKGDLLIYFDDRDLLKELQLAHTNEERATLELQKLEKEPSEENLSLAKANYEKAKLSYELASSEYNRILNLSNPKAISTEERERRQFEKETAFINLNEAQIRLEKIAKGADRLDLEIARTNQREAESQIEKIEVEINKTIITSPINGTVLQIKLEEGEMAPQDTARTPAIIVGNTDCMNLRVSINQFDAPYFDPKSTAIAYLQGDANIKFDLEFLRIEPYLVAKTDLTNDVTEKVDTRVLQIIYRFKHLDHRAYVGEQMDVFIDANFPTVK